MKKPGMTLLGPLILAAAGCSYNGIRMHERQRCGAMPQSSAESCYSRTRMTKEDYDTERRKAAASKSSDGQEKKSVDPRYAEWLP